MVSERNLRALLVGITICWVLLDIVILLNKIELTADIVVAFLFWVACIPIAWSWAKWMARCQFSELMVRRGPKLMAIFRQFSIFLSALGALMCIVLKVIFTVSADTTVEPFPAIVFVIVAAWFYFSLYSWRPTDQVS